MNKKNHENEHENIKHIFMTKVAGVNDTKGKGRPKEVKESGRA